MGCPEADVLRYGQNIVGGIPVAVERRPVRWIGIRIKRDGDVRLSLPKRRGTLAEAEAFLVPQWGWVVRTRERILAAAAAPRPPLDADGLAALAGLVGELMAEWTARLGEPDVTWTFRNMKTRWGSCNSRRRRITFNTELARMDRERIEYVVVHELTHLEIHGHGPDFRALMDRRLPGWTALRRRLNG
jgi:predicted metal-dependent hydrolase